MATSLPSHRLPKHFIRVAGKGSGGHLGMAPGLAEARISCCLWGTSLLLGSASAYPLPLTTAAVVDLLPGRFLAFYSGAARANCRQRACRLAGIVAGLPAGVVGIHLGDFLPSPSVLVLGTGPGCAGS